MLFTITTWIIVLTLLGIVVVYVLRLCARVSVDDDRKRYRESPKQQPPESNHYEPLNLQLKKIAANDANQTDGKQDSGISVAESTLSETKSVEIGAPDEKKPLNTEPETDTLQEVTVSAQSSSELKRSVERSSIVVVQEVRKNEQTLPASVGSVVNPSLDSGGTISLPAVAKVVNVTTAVAPAAAAVVVVDQNAASHKFTRDTTAPAVIGPTTPGDVIAAEPQPYNSEIPMPYVEVESATLPRLSNSNEAAKEIGMPSA